MSTILVVDDSTLIRLVVTSALGRVGLTVQGAASGAAALALCAAAPFDVVLVDWEMPGQSGPELCAALRGCPNRPGALLLMSGHAAAELPELALVCDGFLGKPFAVEELQQAVLQLLTARAPA